MRVIGFLTAVAFAAALPLAASAPADAQLYVGIGAPPAFPTYEQPYNTNPNYQWIPGYWASGQYGYYWVPGTWMAAPQAGLLWTPGYWGYQSAQNNYAWNNGYWGRTVGYYGGLNYGGGYYGNGFAGGNWYGNQFRYNTAVMRVNPRYVHNVYVNRTVVVHNVNRYSYYGPGGSRVAATPQQITYARQTHVGLTPYQRQHIQEAGQDRNLYARVNNGRPAETVVAKPLNATNKPANFKPLTTADKAAAPKLPPNANKPPSAAKPPVEHANPVAKPPANNTKPVAKPPANNTKPVPKPPANNGAYKPPAEHAAPPMHAAPKPAPAHAAVPKPPPQHNAAPKPPPQHAPVPKPPPAAAKPPQNNGGGKPPDQNNNGGKPPR
jgi:hypothetical protein